MLSTLEVGCHGTLAPFRPFHHLSVPSWACTGTDNTQSGVCCAALDEHRATEGDPEWGEIPRPGEVDLLHISPPCQDLSGLNQHTDYPRATRNLLPLIDKVGSFYMRVLFSSASKLRALPVVHAYSRLTGACRISLSMSSGVGWPYSIILSAKVARHLPGCNTIPKRLAKVPQALSPLGEPRRPKEPRVHAAAM